MPVRKLKPITPGQRFRIVNEYSEITTSNPEKSLLKTIKKTGGRNNQGRMTMRYKGGGHKKELVKVAHEMFLMVDEDHSGSVDKKEYNTLIRNFSTNSEEAVEPMNQEQFTRRIIETQDHKKVLNWWWGQSNFSHSLNTTVQMLLLCHTPVTRMVFQYFNCHAIHDKAFLKAVNIRKSIPCLCINESNSFF